MNEKEITIKVPEGKRAEWINGVLTLVDEPKKDNRPVTERIKTFEDACQELGENHAFVAAFRIAEANGAFGSDIIAYMKLRIIVAALNEGWEPEFVKGEYRYYPWFWLYTKEEYDNMDDEDKQRCSILSDYGENAYYCLVLVSAYYGASYSSGYNGSALAFRELGLAKYAGSQFIKEWSNFIFKPRS